MYAACPLFALSLEWLHVDVKVLTIATVCVIEIVEFCCLLSSGHYWWGSLQFIQSAESLHDSSEESLGTKGVEWAMEWRVIILS